MDTKSIAIFLLLLTGTMLAGAMVPLFSGQWFGVMGGVTLAHIAGFLR